MVGWTRAAKARGSGTSKGQFEGAAFSEVGALLGGVTVGEFGAKGGPAGVAGWVLGQGGDADVGGGE